MTFRRFIDDHYLPHAYASKRSANSDDSKFKTHLFEKFGARLLATITRQEIQRYHDELISRRAPATANRHLALLKRCFNLAILWGYIDSNPATGIRMHTENNQSQRFLSIEEAKRLWSALDIDQNPIAANVMMQISSSLTPWVSLDFSYLSAICPANAENRKYGKINSNAAKLFSRLISMPILAAAT